MHSAIYEGIVRHRRFSPAENAFSYRLFMMYLDLAELDRVFAGRWTWSAHRPALARFRREDHFGDPALPLDEAVRQLVAERTGRRPEGPIRLLTHLRYFGYVFNPVSFFYCFGADGETLETIVAEVTNTPWGERHLYVLDERMNIAGGGRMRFRFAKDFHVSPFMAMEADYDWRFTAPRGQLAVHMENWRGGERFFDATMNLKRREISTAALARTLANYPLMTGKVIAAIHWQAAKLWWKGVPFHTHPSKAEGAAQAERGPA